MVKLLWWCLQFSAIIMLGLAAPTDDVSDLVLSISEADMVKILDNYNTKAGEVFNRVGLAEWAVATDVGNKEKEEKLVIITLIT